jgi:hypothetical protein
MFFIYMSAGRPARRPGVRPQRGLDADAGRPPLRPADCAGTSVNAVAENPLPLALWALIIMLLTGFRFRHRAGRAGLVMPWLGHASFHAYKDLVE